MAIYSDQIKEYFKQLLKNLELYNESLTGIRGTYFLENTTAHTGLKLRAIQINQDAVFTTLTITDNTGTTYSALATASSNTYGQNLSGRTVSQGSLLYAPVGTWFSAVTMSSGSAIGVKTTK